MRVNNHLNGMSPGGSCPHYLPLNQLLLTAVEPVSIDLACEETAMTGEIVVAPAKSLVEAQKASANCRHCTMCLPTVVDLHSEDKKRGKAFWRSSVSN